MKVTKKTRLLAAVPIAQSQDGTVKVFSVKDNGQSESFNLAHEWTMKGSGFQRGGTSSGLYVDNVAVFAGEYAANFNSMAITDKTVKLTNAQVELIPAGSYPNARLEIALTDAQSGEIETLYIPVNLIVE